MRQALSNLEQIVLEHLWNCGPSTAESIREALSPRREWTDSTIRTVLRRLEKKGYLRHGLNGKAFVYEGIDSPRNMAASAVRSIIEQFCGGSVEELLVGLVENRVLDGRELKLLADKIAARRGRKRKAI